MSHELKEGLRLKSVSGPVDSEGGGVFIRLGEGPHLCNEIVVVMQPGQMGMVPWAKATQNNGLVVLVNLAQMEHVTLLEKEPTA